MDYMFRIALHVPREEDYPVVYLHLQRLEQWWSDNNDHRNGNQLMIEVEEDSEFAKYWADNAPQLVHYKLVFVTPSVYTGNFWLIWILTRGVFVVTIKGNDVYLLSEGLTTRMIPRDNTFILEDEEVPQEDEAAVQDE